MLIACLGWGSLIWEPGALPIHGDWLPDGPWLPIEFGRQSKDQRLTLVIVPEYSASVRSLWTCFSLRDLGQAREALRAREDTVPRHISAWQAGATEDAAPPGIEAWARKRSLDAVVWTGLPPRLDGVERLPSADEAVAHLRRLPDEQKRRAENYVRMAPLQIDTPYRRRFESEFGWVPTGRSL